MPPVSSSSSKVFSRLGANSGINSNMELNPPGKRNDSRLSLDEEEELFKYSIDD
jgi:hypothetical protein